MANHQIFAQTLLLTTHFTYGMGLPTATQVMFKSEPAMTLYSGSGGIENLGLTRRTKSK